MIPLLPPPLAPGTGRFLTVEIDGADTALLQSGAGDLAFERRLVGVLALAGRGPGAVAIGGPDENVGQLRVDADPLATVGVATVGTNGIAILVDDKRPMLNNGAAGEGRGVFEDGLAVGGDNLGGLEESGRSHNDNFRALVLRSIYCFLFVCPSSGCISMQKTKGQ